MPPRAPGAPHQRAPMPQGPRPMVSGEKPTVNKQNPMAEVRILLKFLTCINYLYTVFFFKVQQGKEQQLSIGNMYTLS